MNKISVFLRFSLLFEMTFIAILPVKSWGAPKLSFFKENITFTICAQDTIEVHGIYWFSNTGDDSISTYITYPFPIDSNAAYPYYIVVAQSDTHKTVAYQKFSRGISWRQSVPARGFDSVSVVYRQKVKKGCGQYIVSTTKLWGKPLQKANFTVRVPRRITMIFWTFQADSVTTTNDTILYHSYFNSFLPDGEMEVHWR